MHNDHVNVIGHPTGRIINKREPYQINLLKIFEAASELGVFKEINAFPNRLDLSDLNCFKAKDYGIRISIGTDAHNKDHLRYMELGVATARRGWLEKKDVINASKGIAYGKMGIGFVVMLFGAYFDEEIRYLRLNRTEYY